MWYFVVFQPSKCKKTHFQPQIWSIWPIFPNDSESLPKVCYIKRKNSEILSKLRNSESAEGSETGPPQKCFDWPPPKLSKCWNHIHFARHLGVFRSEGGPVWDSNVFLKSVTYRPTLSKFRGGPVKKITLYEIYLNNKWKWIGKKGGPHQKAPRVLGIALFSPAPLCTQFE